MPCSAFGSGWRHSLFKVKTFKITFLKETNLLHLYDMAQPGKRGKIRLFARVSTSVKHSSTPYQDLLIFNFAFRGWQSGIRQSRSHSCHKCKYSQVDSIAKHRFAKLTQISRPGYCHSLFNSEKLVRLF